MRNHIHTFVSWKIGEPIDYIAKSFGKVVTCLVSAIDINKATGNTCSQLHSGNPRERFSPGLYLLAVYF